MKKKKIFMIILISLISLFILGLKTSNTKAIYKEEKTKKIKINISNSTYNIIFDGNGSTSGTTEIVTCTYNEDCTLTENGFEKTGHIFKGWSIFKNGIKVYDDKAIIKNLSVSEDVTLYAVWQEVWAKDLSYDNTKTGLNCQDVQCALDEISALLN